MKAIFILAVLALAFLVVGCSSETSVGQQVGGEKTPVSNVAESAPSAAHNSDANEAAMYVEVSIYDSGYRPSTVTISKGGTVKWTNKGQTDHTVYGSTFPMTSTKDQQNSGRLQPGESWEKTFNDEGFFGYADIYDENLKGKVVVE